MKIKRLIPLLLLILLVSSVITYATLEYLEIVEDENKSEAQVDRLLPLLSSAKCSFDNCLLVKDSIADLKNNPWLDHTRYQQIKEAYEQCAINLWESKIATLDCLSIDPSEISKLNRFHQLHTPDLAKSLDSKITETTSALYSVSTLKNTMESLEGQIKGMKHGMYDASEWDNLKSKLQTELSKCQLLNSTLSGCSFHDYTPLMYDLNTSKQQHKNAHTEFIRITTNLKYDDLTDCKSLPDHISPNLSISWSKFAEYKSRLSSLRRDLCQITLEIWPV